MLKTHRITAGTVLSQNLLGVPNDALPDTEVVMTIIGGRIRYRDGEILR